MPTALNHQQILQAHQLYCQLTGQQIRLDMLRERQWFELLRLGFDCEHLRRVIRYLQREIRAGRRNVGALKLSNLLQPDRFEEDLQIRNLRLESPPPSPPSKTPLPPAQQELLRRQALQHLRRFKQTHP